MIVYHKDCQLSSHYRRINSPWPGRDFRAESDPGFICARRDFVPPIQGSNGRLSVDTSGRYAHIVDGGAAGSGTPSRVI